MEMTTASWLSEPKRPRREVDAISPRYRGAATVAMPVGGWKMVKGDEKEGSQKMEMTTASWLSEPKRPREEVEAISPRYRGAATVAMPVGGCKMVKGGEEEGSQRAECMREWDGADGKSVGAGRRASSAGAGRRSTKGAWGGGNSALPTLDPGPRTFRLFALGNAFDF
jgi:hypothetical protein